MNRRIRLSPSVVVLETDAGVLIRSDLGTFRLEGSDVSVALRELLPLLDGSREDAEIARSVSGYSPESVSALLKTLDGFGLVERVDDGDVLRGQDEFLEKLGAPDGRAALAASSVLAVGLEPWSVAACAELAVAGVGRIALLDSASVDVGELGFVRQFGDADIGQPRGEVVRRWIVDRVPSCKVTSDRLELAGEFVLSEGAYDVLLVGLPDDAVAEGENLARAAHHARIRSVYAGFDGLDAFIGSVTPGETACWACTRQRVIANAEHAGVRQALDQSLKARPSSLRRRRTYLAPMPGMLGHMVALEVIKLVTRYAPSETMGRQLVCNLVTLETKLHTVVRLPWCRICGGAGGDAEHTRELSDAGDEEGDRGGAILGGSGSAEELRAALAGWVDDRSGVVRTLMVNRPEVGEPELPIAASAVLGAPVDNVAAPNPPEVASGKGATAVDALLGAVGEAIERYSAARFKKSALHRAMMKELEGDVLDPRRLALYEDWQYAQPNFHFAPFAPGRALDWVRGRWADTDEPVWVPALTAFLNYDAPADEYFCQVSSNGLAAGSNLADASFRAICELAERDAFMISWLAMRAPKRLIFNGDLEPALHEIGRQLLELGVETECYLLDAGAGTAVPTAVCLGLGDGEDWPGATVALAAHPSVRTALRKAILEHGHVAPFIRRLMHDGEHRIPDSPEAVQTLNDHALYYAPRERQDALSFFRSGPEIRLTDLAESTDLSTNSLLTRLREVGIRVGLVDVTSPDVALGPFRVVRALGPDVQAIHFGFATRQLANPRLTAATNGATNPHPHPLA